SPITCRNAHTNWISRGPTVLPSRREAAARGAPTMSIKTLQATHPDMVMGLSSQRLRDHYLVSGIFQDDKISLTHSHVERFVIGGAKPVSRALKLEPMKAGGETFLTRREIGIINVGGPGRVIVDGE